MHNNDSIIISLLRFPMIVGIVLIHSGIELDYPLSKYYIYNFFVNRLTIGGITRICVPLFFIISGYLFFYHLKSWNKDVFLYKLRRRAKSLLIPYLLWNTLAICMFALMALGNPSSQSGATPPIQNWNLKVILSLYWAKQPDNIPIVPQFWFVRNLMVMVLLTPIIHWLIKKTDIFLLIVSGVLWGLNISEYSIPGTMGCFFFSLGAYFSINNINVSIVCRKYKLLGFFYPPFLIADIITKEITYNIYIHNLAIICGIVFIINIANFFLKQHSNISPNKFLLSSTFFVFAAHEPYMGKFKTLCYKVFPDISQNNIIADVQFILYYLIIAFLWIALLISIYSLLRRFFPRLTAALSGDR